MAATAAEGTLVWVQQSILDSANTSRSSQSSTVTNQRININLSNTGKNISSKTKNKTLPVLQKADAKVLNRKGFFNPANSNSDTDSCASSLHSAGRNEWGWKKGQLIAHSSDGSLVVQLCDDDDVFNNSSAPVTTTLPATALQSGQVVLGNDFPCNADGQPVPPHDLITLTHLHEPAVVESLQYRFAMSSIYTFTGPVLLAVNPFTTIRGLYGETVMRQYWERAEHQFSFVKIPSSPSGSGVLPPHVYALADSSFRSMMRLLEDAPDIHHAIVDSGCNQSILVSGESGSGKTVTTKLVMKYLAALSQRSVTLQSPEKRAYIKAAEQRTPQHRKTKSTKENNLSAWNTSTPSRKASLNDDFHLASAVTNSTEAQVLQSNPILESFGNARTVRNDNSSRFGKFVEIQFTRFGQLVGAQMETYLLEKVRLLRQAPGERNFHIFYELLSGSMDARELSQYFIAKTATPSDFKLTASSGTTDRRDGVSDRDTYWQLRTALNTMKFSLDEVHELFSVTTALLHASNLTFVELPENESCELDINNLHLPAVCHLLGVTPEKLNTALCSCSIQAGNQIITKELSLPMAERGLEALLKETYGALFNYLVLRINDSIAFKDRHYESEQDGHFDDTTLIFSRQPAASIGVLDIFGFESFHKNSFEQLCINYCNEALQQQFNAFVLRNEQAEYEREGIEWSFIEFPENQDVLDLIEKRGSGILSILDDQCRAPGPSDKAFVLEVYKQCASSSRFEANRKQTATLHFSIEHYAGHVEYSTEGFVEKNRDELPKESTELLKCSVSYFVQDLACIIEDVPEMPKESSSVSQRLRRADSTVARATVGGQFRRQLRDLRSKIDKTSPHYIRCLKPNDSLVPDVFDTAIVAEQLRCGGILEAVRVARAGFTQHYLHADFVRRYRSLAWKELDKKDAFRQKQGPSSLSYSTAAPKRRNNYNNVENGSRTTKHMARTNSSDIDTSEAKTLCISLLKVLYKKIMQQMKEDEKEVVSNESKVEDGLQVDITSNDRNIVSSKLSFGGTRKTMTTPTTKSTPQRDNENKNYITDLAQTPWNRPTESLTREKSTTIAPGWKRGGLTATDYTKVGLQMGKTKVFLRHKAFEILERIRSLEQSHAATKLNAVFRMYLARQAYIPYRNAFRMEMKERRLQLDSDEFKETKEQDYDDHINMQASRFQGSIGAFNTHVSYSISLVDKWMDSKIRDAIHNPVPRSEWGKQAPTRGDFKWVLQEGLWVKNYADFD